MKPAFVIQADGEDITAAINDRLISLVVTDCAGEDSDELTIELHNTDERLDAPAEGRTLEVFLGFDGNVVSVGRFAVDEVSAAGPPSTVTIQARSAPFQLSLIHI